MVAERPLGFYLYVSFCVPSTYYASGDNALSFQRIGAVYPDSRDTVYTYGDDGNDGNDDNDDDNYDGNLKLWQKIKQRSTNSSNAQP